MRLRLGAALVVVGLSLAGCGQQNVRLPERHPPRTIRITAADRNVNAILFGQELPDGLLVCVEQRYAEAAAACVYLEELRRRLLLLTATGRAAP
jgi:hypothetical protein